WQRNLGLCTTASNGAGQRLRNRSSPVFSSRVKLGRGCRWRPARMAGPIILGVGDGQVAIADFLDVQAFVDGVLGFYSIALNAKGHFPGELVDPPFGP